MGTTNGDGAWSTTGTFDLADNGSWRETWTVGGNEVDPSPLSFTVSPPIPACDINWEDISGEGFSIAS